MQTTINLNDNLDVKRSAKITLKDGLIKQKTILTLNKWAFYISLHMTGDHLFVKKGHPGWKWSWVNEW